MKSSTVIRAIQSITLFNDKVLVDFVTRNLASVTSSHDDSLPVNFLTLAWASTIIPVKGTLGILFENHLSAISEKVHIPVDSLFFITCTKDETGNYKVAWSQSLS